mmetsp:Transcript_141615/g.452879  ORF Transcript_141615/g.452879 Transcript_141615/m.452879 type:complete len:285 (+) Transcript_141615:792-1646(+)
MALEPSTSAQRAMPRPWPPVTDACDTETVRTAPLGEPRLQAQPSGSSQEPGMSRRTSEQPGGSKPSLRSSSPPVPAPPEPPDPSPAPGCAVESKASSAGDAGSVSSTPSVRAARRASGSLRCHREGSAPAQVEGTSAAASSDTRDSPGAVQTSNSCRPPRCSSATCRRKRAQLASRSSRYRGTSGGTWSLAPEGAASSSSRSCSSASRKDRSLWKQSASTRSAGSRERRLGRARRPNRGCEGGGDLAGAAGAGRAEAPPSSASSMSAHHSLEGEVGVRAASLLP